MKRPGALAILLHTHMPYVEGFGTWPFGEEWLWEAIATSYLPLLGVLGQGPLTLSLTPVLCDQLEAPGAMERCLAFLREIRPESHRLDIEELERAGETALVAELERSADEYAARAQQLAGLPGKNLLSALGAHASWTSAATHAVLPLLVSDSAIRLQTHTGIAAHRRRFGEWVGGFWLPECAHAPWLDELLEEAGVRHTCVELTGRLGLGDPGHLAPIATEAGPVLWPIDRQTMSLVWSSEGYPSAGAYRSYHALTARHHRPWANHGGPYDPAAARRLAGEHAADFVARVSERVRDGGVCVCALDTELLGHWWYEGVFWLDQVLRESARQGLSLTTLDEALDSATPKPPRAPLPVSSWGDGGDLRTWSGAPVADLAWQVRTAELDVLARGPDIAPDVLRGLLALQSSDWAFLETRGTAGPYPRQRAQRHAQALARALAGADGIQAELRNLAPNPAGWPG